jgi:uncharacterized protein DUF1360
LELDAYAPSEKRPPLASYAITMATFGSLFGAALLAVKRSGRSLPERVGGADVVAIGVAAHKISRMVSKDRVTSPIRAPFTELEGSGGPAELSERSRGSGARRVIGELLVCPYCLGLWVAAALSFGLVFAPRLTRFVAAIFSALTLSDFLQIAYKSAEDKGLG